MHADKASTRDKRPALKADLAEFERKLERRVEAQGHMIRNVAKELTRYKSEVSAQFDLHEAAAVRIRSEILGEVDSFMSKSMKIDTDQTILIGRMDRLEDTIDKGGA